MKSQGKPGGKATLIHIFQCISPEIGEISIYTRFSLANLRGSAIIKPVVPLSIALALASGVGPEQGIYTAIVAGFLISFFGGSRVQIAGPTAAFATIVAGIVAQHGMDGLVGEENFCSHIDEALARAEALYPEENQ